MTRRVETLGGVALVAVAAAIPIGEGVTWAAVSLWAVALAWRWRDLQIAALRASEVRAFGLGIAAWILAGVAAGLLAGTGLPSARALGPILPMALPLLLLISQPSPRWLRRAAIAFVVALALASILGVVQYVYNVRPGEFIARTDALALAQGRLPGDLQRTAAGGFYFHRLKLAHVLMIGIAALVARQVVWPLARGRRILELSLLGLLSVALALTFSRAAVVAIVAAIGLGLAARAPRGPLVAGGLAIALLLLSPWAGGADQLAALNPTVATRGLIWSRAVEVIGDHPLGAGLGQYRLVADRYLEATEPGIVPPGAGAHSLVLTTWAETGPLGLAGFAWAWLGLAWFCARRLRDRSATIGEQTWALTGVIALTALWGAGLMHDPFFHRVVALAFFALVGALLLQRPTQAADPGPVA